ncbi:MAG: hypothetical protein PUI41_02640 [Lachnospiraceae bacterium]|nr:hypothetical protein [Lachnospiraceae bacterium]MDD7049806.1 hypothetical protein [Lachnospiraceae bacterium]MDY4096982.1 hypothetical protein [Lachnospiraceae bacterium]
MNKRKTGKKVGMILLGLAGALTISITALAEGGGRSTKLLSKGSINYENGKVFFSAKDLVYLAEEMDKLENRYKVETVDTLAAIGTYFRSDGSAVQDKGLREVDTQAQKTALSFGEIKTGILNSQSVGSVSQLQATDKAGNLLYYENETAGNHADLSHTTTTNTGYPVYYHAATAGNLSAGAAAWVNGTLLRGNGADNAAFYAQGFVDGQQDAAGNLKISYTYHVHEGDAAAEGGCYGYKTGISPVYCECTGWMYEIREDGVTYCGGCGHGGDFHVDGGCNGVRSYQSYSYIDLICSKTEQTIESATITY